MKFCNKKYDDWRRIYRRKILIFLTTVLLIFLIWIISYLKSNITNNINYEYSFSLRDKKERRLKYQQNFRRFEDNNFIKSNKIFHGEKIVHLDLKGAPPKIKYYDKLFQLLSLMGTTGVIIEYEDMFPYHGSLIGNISALNAYSLSDIETINNNAKKHGLKIIPLVQTFGHMEFLLKLEEWKHLREIQKYPQVICPTHKETLIVLKEMIEQILRAHPNSKMIHIGADEVYLLGKCEKCFVKMNQTGWTKQKLFLSHVVAVSHIIKESHPDIRILMWDDEFRNIKQEDLEQWQISRLVEPVVWKYGPDVYFQLGPNLWDVYINVFPKIWIASAFKGATGSNKYITDIGYHLENHKSWMQIVSEYSDKINFEGIIITGWQRYDHFAILCELLPVGMPSLAMCLHYIQGFYNSSFTVPKPVIDLLQCDNPYALHGTAWGTPKCNFYGGDILEGVLRLHQLEQEFSVLLDNSVIRGWVTDYNINHSFSNVLLLTSAMENLDMFKMDLIQIERDLRMSMTLIYDNYTINEWCETFIQPFHKKIENLWEAKEKLMSKEHWPRRPLTKGDL